MITKEQAVGLVRGQRLKSTTMKDSQGQPIQCRVNGKAKTWVTRPESFCMPAKRGLWTFFYITEDNAKYWEVA